MSESPKAIVRAFYESDISKNISEITNQFLHPDCELNWNNNTGYTKFNFNDITEFLNSLSVSFESARFQVSHLLQDGDFITTRYTLFVTPIEDPEAEAAMAHYITIWEIKDGKLYRGHEISQSADENKESLHSYLKIKV